MAQYDHLPLRSVGELGDRRKSRPGPPTDRKHAKHAKKITNEVQAVVDKFTTLPTPPDRIDPTLIIKVELTRQLPPEVWDAVDLRTISQIENEAVILFSSDTELTEFRRRIKEYSGPKPSNQANHSYAGLINEIESISDLTAQDRIGHSLQQNGFTSFDKLLTDTTYILDVEIWRPPMPMVEVFVDRVTVPFVNAGGDVLDRYSSSIGILLRVQGNGQLIRQLLEHPEVASINLPPKPDLETSDAPDPTIDDLGEILDPDQSAIPIGIVDSGINDQHPLLKNVVIGAFGVAGLPSSDAFGHGTAVAGVAAYGDLENMLNAGKFQARFKIASARVLDDTGNFPDKKIAHKLVEEAIRRLHKEYGCRVINMSLADRNSIVTARGTLWSEVLDKLANELDLIIVVSAGNSDKGKLVKTYSDAIAKAYPSYLLDKVNRILDPAGAMNVLTVGSVAHNNGLAEGDPLTIQSIASEDEPSPFTRTGPGITDALKPDFVDRGGNAVFDGLNYKLRVGNEHPPAGILSLHNDYTHRLFKTVSGTSFATPLVSYKSAMIVEEYKNTSANLVRSLLAVSSEQPERGLEKLNSTEPKIRHSVFGYGVPYVFRALYSEDSRVILTAESTLPPNKFAIFELPIPEDYQSTNGERQIRVALAFRPNVRRTRKDYLGTVMQFDLIRGKSSLVEITEAYRAATKEERQEKVKLPTVGGSEVCSFLPNITSRKLGTCLLYTSDAADE